MRTLSNDEILNLIAPVTIAGIPLNQLADVALAERAGGEETVTVKLRVPVKSLLGEIESELKGVLSAVIPNFKLAIEQEILASPSLNAQKAVAGVKNIIAVASGKGGVGKSTTSVNLALALSAEGARVGILDADIYGPSQSHMLGIEGVRPDVAQGNKIIPIEKYGVQCVSMGNLVNENTPMIWRGPMVSGALQQLLNSTLWQDVDYLIVDMPPGTGDIQLTLSQSVPVTGAVIVTTPQDIALLDAKKGIEMFRKVQVPVLGVVENMSTHTCSQCGHREAVFGEHGGDRLAEEFNVALLGRLPLQLSIREQTDAGKPTVAVDAQSEVAQEYIQIARSMVVNMWSSAQAQGAGPEISFDDD